MSNPLPYEKAVKQLLDAIAAHRKAVLDFDRIKSPARFGLMRDAYSKVSLAQWELDHIVQTDREAAL